jgi:hypothetical protein
MLLESFIHILIICFSQSYSSYAKIAILYASSNTDTTNKWLTNRLLKVFDGS